MTVALLQPDQSYSVLVTPHLTLLDSELAVVADLTDRLIPTGSHVAYTHQARNPHSASLGLTGEALDWGAARLRLAMTIQDQLTGEATTRELGRYVVGSATRGGERPDEWRVELADLSVMLDQATGRTWTVYAQETVQQAVGRVVEAADVPVKVRDDLVGERVPASRVWPITDSATWLDVLAHLAEATGGRHPYTTPTGEVLLTKYVRLSDLPDTLTLGEREDTLLMPGATVDTDLHITPNEVIVIADVTNLQGSVTRTVEHRRNWEHGPTSYQARGWWQRAVHTVDAISASDLTVAADRIWDDSQYHAVVVTALLTPTHRLWAHDVVELDAPSLGLPDQRAFVRGWQLPLDSSPMQVTLGVL